MMFFLKVSGGEGECQILVELFGNSVITDKSDRLIINIST